ncbi:uncharacterized protein LOC131164968 [Malania oleifera]|uniref:uncharacterized protein LOC131164968 n=1 Tax=Malania oleifera TaxID=397392 RepID=UPI0025AEAC50|nr:uncharacterized protein LOC131164968 [Malania oleifera]
MPLTDPRAGSCLVWLVSSILLAATLTGGIFLSVYIIFPEPRPWLPVAGVSLVCLPWFFWFLTFLYRVFSQLCGGRAGGGGTGGGAGGGNGGNNINVANAMSTGDAPPPEEGRPSGDEEDSPVVSPGTGARRVHFGGAVVVGDHRPLQDGHDNPPETKSINQSTVSTSSSNSDNNNSFASHESEMPLTLSMAS